jgi:hypothetical protein
MRKKTTKKVQEQSKTIHDMGEAGCILCQNCYEEDNKLVCEMWNKIVHESDYCDSYIFRT